MLSSVYRQDFVVGGAICLSEFQRLREELKLGRQHKHLSAAKVVIVIIVDLIINVVAIISGTAVLVLVLVEPDRIS